MKSIMIIALASSALSVAACNKAETDTHTADTAHHDAVETVEQLDAPATISADIYPGPTREPNYGPAYGSITFVDEDPGPTIGGTLMMGRAVDNDGNRLDEVSEGITQYMIHWGLIVGAPGIEDDAGAGDLGGDCRGFRDTGYVVMISTSDLGENGNMSWNIPIGTEVPEGAVYFVGHTLYGPIHNLAKCTQTPIVNLLE